MFKWMLMFVFVLGVILAFVSFVMGVPIPGLDWIGVQQPSSPFQP
jgi:ABC-type polysaccharide transport system permease subunit